ncbi:protein of unknown function [Streptomyces sp. KY75]|nr:protein of unknown function [Streptomyces sp. KY70]CAD5986902.1 protein of unknown function [Streptomyces sp. KY75]
MRSLPTGPVPSRLPRCDPIDLMDPMGPMDRIGSGGSAPGGLEGFRLQAPWPHAGVAGRSQAAK